MSEVVKDALVDRALLEQWLCGNQQAIDLVMSWFAIFHVWDDLKDKDSPLADDAIDDSMYAMLIAVPNNPFFSANRSLLTGQLTTAIFEWHAANELEAGADPHDLEIAYTLRCNVVGLIQLCALLCGGPKHARAVGPEIRRYAQRETLAQYVEDLGHA